MTAVRGGAPTAGPLRASRREYALGLALGAAGAGLVLLSARQGWARVATPAPAPLPASVVSVSGQDLVPLGRGQVIQVVNHEIAGMPGRGVFE